MTRPEPNRSNRGKPNARRRDPAEPTDTEPTQTESNDTEPTDTEPTDTESTQTEPTQTEPTDPHRGTEPLEPDDGARTDQSPIDDSETEPGMADLQTDLDPIEPFGSAAVPTGGVEAMPLPHFQPAPHQAPLDRQAPHQPAPPPRWDDRLMRDAGTDRGRMPPIGDDMTSFFFRHRRQMITLVSLMILFALVYVAVGQLNLSGSGS